MNLIVKSGKTIKRFEIWNVSLDPIIGKEISKSRLCIVISPDELNKNLQTVIVAPLTHTIKSYPSRIICNINNQKGEIALDQMRAVDKLRFINKIETFSQNNALVLIDKSQEIFSY